MNTVPLRDLLESLTQVLRAERPSAVVKPTIITGTSETATATLGTLTYQNGKTVVRLYFQDGGVSGVYETGARAWYGPIPTFERSRPLDDPDVDLVKLVLGLDNTEA